MELVFVRDHVYPNRKAALRTLTVFSLIYLVWLYVIKHNTGKWVYNIFAVLNGPQRMAFFIASGLVTTGLYFIGEFTNKMFAIVEAPVQKKKKKTK